MCEWNDRCGYGCRIEALAQGNGLEGRDERVCAFVNYPDFHFV